MITIEAPVEIPVKETPAAPVETPKPLKISEALRLGAMMTKQTFGALGDLKTYTCAIGAMAYGFGARDSEEAGEIFRQLKGAVVDTPCKCNIRSIGIQDVMVHLNDTDHWPREKIADWLETLGL